jgi:signal transduction histidine kinase
MPLKTIKGNLLFWKIAGIFTLLLVLLEVTYIGIASRVSRKSFDEINQQLYGNIASHLAESMHPLKEGRPDTLVTHDIIHSIMVINPSVEVYLLNPEGKIIDFVVPDKSVKVRQVDMAAVRQYLSDEGKKYVQGVNPKHPERKSIFSAAPVYEHGQLTGYVYTVLASEKQEAVVEALNKHFFNSLEADLFFVTLFVAFLVGIITFFLITDSICKISFIVKRFKEGDYDARIEGYAKGNLGLLATTFNEMADTIVTNMDKIKSMDKLRQELIANVSHDLRSPLAIMQGYIETLVIKGNNIPEEEKARYLSIILDSSRKLSHLVGQLFEYSKLEANQVEPQKEQFLLTELVSDILMKYEMPAKEKKIDLRMESRENLPAVFADISLVERVIQNLLDNSLKFTPEHGKITVTLQDKITGIEVSVSDTGSGIPLKDQPYIFERHKQLPGKEAVIYEGMGLGLSIVKKILDLHQAAINIKSAPGVGTSFRFQLPVYQRRPSLIPL